MRTVFLDRDGVINRRRKHYVTTWAEFHMLPGVVDSIVRLTRSGFRVIVVTNQSAIGRGLVSRTVVDDIHERVAARVQKAGGRISAFLVCPHTPDDGCPCRKPAAGLLLLAQTEMQVDLATAMLVGDQLTDVEAANAAGCLPIIVQASRKQAAMARQLGALVALSLPHAVDEILRSTMRPSREPGTWEAGQGPSMG